MDWLKHLAPTLATVLAGPLAGLAVQAIGSAMGMSDATGERINEVLTSGNMTGEQVAALKKAEIDLKAKLAELQIKPEEIAAQDRASARELAKSNMLPQIVLSAIYSVGYFTLLYQFATDAIVIPLQNKDLLMPLLGVMTAAQVQIMNFWFGSSAGSAAKNDLLKPKSE